MGRKESKLIPFLKEALSKDKYSNLKFEDTVNQTFTLFLPQKSCRLDVDSQLVLRDWYKVKDRPYRMKNDYTEAKQGMEAALRKSDFLELVRKLVHNGRITKYYRILTPSEVRDKKSFKKAQKKALKSDPYENSEYAPSPESSGYGSGSENNDEIFESDGSHALLHALNHDHEYHARTTILKMGQASIDEITQLGGYVEDVHFVTDPPHIEIEGVLYKNALPSYQLESFVAPGPESQNSFGNLDFSCLQDVFLDEGDTSPVQDTVMGEISLNPPFDVDSSFISNPEHAKLVDECLEDLEDFFADLEENSVTRDISVASGLDITSFKTKTVKVYECLYLQNLPDMIMLTCQPKLKEFCMSDTNENEPSTSRLIFDEATFHLVSKYTVENMQFLPNDHLLVFLKCEELVHNLL